MPEYAQNPAGTKMLGTISLLLRGIPFIYQGQEIGMQNAVWNSLPAVQSGQVVELPASPYFNQGYSPIGRELLLDEILEMLDGTAKN